MITDSFDNKTEPVFTLKDFYGEKKRVLDICFIIFSKEIYETVLDTYSCTQIAEISEVNGAVPIYKFSHEGKEIAFYLSAIGATGTAEYCIEANWLTGAKKFIMFGSAGSLNKEKTQGKFVVPTEAYRDEGVSYHYAPPSDYIKIKNHEKLASIFDELQLSYVEGKVWTTDAFLRETAAQVAARQREGCVAVDMELAGVQSVCDFYGFDLYNFLVTGDVLSEEKYETERLYDANHNLDKFYIALEIAKRIGENMEIKTFDSSYLQETKAVLKDAFFREGSNEAFNEWEFAEMVLQSDGYLPELCVIALDGETVIGYNILTKAKIGGQSGLALGPLGVRKEYQNAGVGTALVKECIKRAARSGYPWIALLGGDYYFRFGFEKGSPYGITVSDNGFDNEHLQLLFLKESAKKQISGKLVYCSAFYDSNGNLL